MPEGDSVAQERRPFHPLLFAAHPIVALYASNTAVVPIETVFRPLAIAMGAALIMWFVVGRLLKDPYRSAMAVSMAALLFFEYRRLELLAKALWSNWLGYEMKDPQEFFWIWVGLSTLLILIAAAGFNRKQFWAALLNIVSGALVGTAIVMAAASAMKSAPRSDARGSSGIVADGQKPDVFYILLDGFGRSDTLREKLGVDTSPFLEGLRKRGFFVADRSRSNYTQTELSLASTLNMEHIAQLFAANPDVPRDRTGLDAMIANNRVAKELAKVGYQFVFVSSGFPSFEGRVGQVRMASNPGGLSTLEAALLDETPIKAPASGSLSPAAAKRSHVESAFRNLRLLANRGRSPRFVFAHLLVPHPPFVFEADGRPRKPLTTGLHDGNHYFNFGGTMEEYRHGYGAQAAHAATRTLEAIDALLATSGPDPIIIVQGDHGPKSGHHSDSLEKTDLREVLCILNAYRVPEAVRARLYPDITPVNTFRLVLPALTGASYERLPDRSYYAEWDHPFDLVDVSKDL